MRRYLRGVTLSTRTRRATRAFSDSLDWTKFAGKKGGAPFQAMATDLLFSELGESGFTPGPTHGGRDGAWDGKYDGKIESTRARWKVAAAVRASFDTLKTKADDENISARRDNAEALLLMTPLDLDNTHCIAIDRVLGKRLKKGGRIWPRSLLEYYLEKNPWVAAKHFGIRYVGGFVPVNQQSLIDHLAQPDLKLVGRSSEVSEIDAFLDGDQAVLLIVGSGGSGKSRLIRELPNVLRRRPARRRGTAWSRNAAAGSINDELAPVVRRKGSVVCLDDAGRYLDEAAELGHIAQARSDLGLKAVLTCRPADQASVEHVLREGQVDFTTINLHPLPPTDALRLLADEFPNLRETVTKQLIEHFGENLYLLRFAAAAIDRGESPAELVDDVRVRAFLSERLVREAASLLGKNTSEAERILIRCALDSPIPEAVANDDVDVRTLLEGGVLRTIGTGVRFRHDVEGDLLLAHQAGQPRGRATITALMRQRSHTIHSVVANVAAAGRGHVAALVGEVLQQWTTTIDALSLADRRRILRTIPRCAEVAPERALELYEAIQGTAASALGDHARALTTDDCGPAIIAIARAGKIRDALKLTLDLPRSDVREGNYANYKLPGLAEEIVHPAHQSPARVIAAIEELADWLRTPADAARKAQISSAVLKAVLARSVSWTSSDGTTMTMHTQGFAPTEPIIQVRNRALDLLLQALQHDSADIRLAAAEVASALDWDRGLANTTEMDAVVEAELAVVLPALDRRLRNEPEARILHVIEDGLVRRWAAARVGHEQAGAMLRAWARPVVVSAYDYASGAWGWSPTLSEILDSAPSDKRWEWWVDKTHRDADPDDVRRLIEQLDQECERRGDSAKVMTQLSSARAASMLFDPWCNINPARFDSVAGNSTVAADVKRLVETSLRRHRLRHDPNRIWDELEAPLVSGDVERIRQLLETAPWPSPQLRLQIAARLVESPVVAIRAIGLRYVAFANDAPRETAELFAVAMRDGDWTKAWDSVWNVLHRAEVREFVAKDEETLQHIKSCAAESLRTYERYRGIDEWHFNESIKYVLQDDLIQRLDLIGAVISDDSIWNLGDVTAPLLDSVDGVSMLAQRCRAWVSDGKLSGAAEVARLLEQALDRRDLPKEAVNVGTALAVAADGPSKMVGIAILSELRQSAEACAALASIAANAKDELHKDAGRLLDNFDGPRGAWIAGPGEPPPVYVAQQKVLENALTLCNKATERTLIRRLLRNVENAIERHLKYDEDVRRTR